MTVSWMQRWLCIGMASCLWGCSQGLAAYGGYSDTGAWEGSSDSGFMDEEEPEDEPLPEEEEEPEPEPECSREGFVSTASQTTLNATDPNRIKLVHRSVNVSGYPNDELQLVSFQGSPYYGPSQPGTYSVDGLNMSDCGLCLVVLASCVATECDKTFFARSGTVKVVSLDGVGGSFAADLKDVIMEEVNVDPYTYESTPVAGGETWCLDDVRIDDPYILPGF